MARTAATDDGKPAAPKKPSMISVVIEMAFLTCFAVGAGGLFVRTEKHLWRIGQ